MTAKQHEPGDDPRRVDLHAHTDASDGVHAPAKVVRMAKDAVLAAVAITDHDTFAGIPEALAAGVELGVEVIPGVELSAYEGKAAVHVVGLFINPADPANAAGLAKVEAFREYRETRMHTMIERLRGIGVEVDPEEVTAESGGGAVGRPHLAAVLVRRGFVADANEAFGRWLGNDGPVYVRKKEMTPEEAIALVNELGGLAVLAHPGTSRIDERFRELKAAGLEALEVWHPKHNRADERHYAKLAARHWLLASGGSDFHGEGRTEARLGRPAVGYAVLEALRARHAAASATEPRRR